MGDFKSSRRAVIETLPLPRQSTLIDESPTTTTCFLCDDEFDVGDAQRDLFLSHSITQHKLVIGDVALISDLTSYVAYWKERFGQVGGASSNLGPGSFFLNKCLTIRFRASWRSSARWSRPIVARGIRSRPSFTICCVTVSPKTAKSAKSWTIPGWRSFFNIKNMIDRASILTKCAFFVPPSLSAGTQKWRTFLTIWARSISSISDIQTIWSLSTSLLKRYGPGWTGCSVSAV